MNVQSQRKPEEPQGNIIPLHPAEARREKPRQLRQRFKIQIFKNRTGTSSWRVTGTKRDGERVRENFTQEQAAQVRQNALETEWLTGQARTEIKATKLTDDQIRLAESAFIRLGVDQELPLAVEYWLAHGKQLSIVGSPKLDEAVDAFMEWLKATPTLHDRTKDKYKSRVNLFRRAVPNLHVSDIQPATLRGFFKGRSAVTARTRVGDKEAISRFFTWCVEHDPQWAAMNPCTAVTIEVGEDGRQTQVLSVKECRELLRAAEQDGDLVPYLAVCLFGGLRPEEAQKLKWDHVNLIDREVTVLARTSKVNQMRVIKMSTTLHAWLKACEGKPFKPKGFRRRFDALKASRGYTGRSAAAGAAKPWPVDVLRHTAVSHYFRHTGSYGLTAEWAGNSEAVIRKHYPARVSSKDTRAFYRIMPGKGKP